jgi:hypothetical protein
MEMFSYLALLFWQASAQFAAIGLDYSFLIA